MTDSIFAIHSAIGSIEHFRSISSSGEARLTK